MHVPANDHQSGKLFIYLIVLMTLFMFLSHGTQDLYSDFLKHEYKVDSRAVADLAILYNVVAFWPVADIGPSANLNHLLSASVNRVHEVQDLLGGSGLESVTESKHEIVTESVESVTESKAEPIEDFRRIAERWGEKLVPHQEASGQVKQPRWSKCWEMWQMEKGAL
jgi:hypothetical protein